MLHRSLFAYFLRQDSIHKDSSSRKDFFAATDFLVQSGAFEADRILPSQLYQASYESDMKPSILPLFAFLDVAIPSAPIVEH